MPAPTTQAVIDQLNEVGALVVVAACNWGDDASVHSLPNYQNVFAVGAIDDQGHLASFSSYDRETVNANAPGVAIRSTWLTNRYVQRSGTSQAAPFVSGSIALLWRRLPTLSGPEVLRVITQTCNDPNGVQGIAPDHWDAALLSEVTPISITPQSLERCIARYEASNVTVNGGLQQANLNRTTVASPKAESDEADELDGVTVAAVSVALVGIGLMGGVVLWMWVRPVKAQQWTGGKRRFGTVHSLSAPLKSGSKHQV